MKKSVFLVALLSMVLLVDFLPAADTPLQSRAALEELREFIRRTNSRLSDLEEAQVEQQRVINQLEQENRKLRSEISKAGNQNQISAMESNLKQLASHIEAVDKKRVADFNATRDEFKKLGRAMSKTTSNQPTTKPAVIPEDADVFKYKIQQGDYLYNIVSKLQKQNVFVTVDQIKKANPKVVWTKLQVGQEILIPVIEN